MVAKDGESSMSLIYLQFFLGPDDVLVTWMREKVPSPVKRLPWAEMGSETC